MRWRTPRRRRHRQGPSQIHRKAQPIRKRVRDCHHGREQWRRRRSRPTVMVGHDLGDFIRQLPLPHQHARDIFVDLSHDFIQDRGFERGLALAPLAEHDEDGRDADIVQKAAQEGMSES